METNLLDAAASIRNDPLPTVPSAIPPPVADVEPIQQPEPVAPPPPKTPHETFLSKGNEPHPDVVGAYNAMRDYAADILLDTDVQARVFEIEQQKLQPLVDMGLKIALEKQAVIDAELANRPNLRDVTSAQFNINTVLGASMLRQNIPIMPRQEGYNPLDDDIDNYWPIANQLVTSVHPAQTAAMKANYDFEKEQRQIISRASLPVDIVASIATGFSDPTNLLLLIPPVGAVARAGMAAKFAYGAGMATTANAINEVLLHDIQSQRTIDESALNVLSGVLLDGAIGGAIMTRGIVKSADYDAAKNAINDYFKRGGVVDNDDGLAALGAKLDSAGAMRVGETEDFSPTHFDPKKNPIRWVLNETAYGMTRLIRTPLGKGLFATNNKVRETTAELVETNIKLNSEILGHAAETLIKTDYRMANEVRLNMAAMEKQAFEDYGMTPEQFNAEVDFATRRGDVHENPLIQKAAQESMKLTREMFPRAAELKIPGTFKEVTTESVDMVDGVPKITKTTTIEPLDTATAISYQTRVYDKKKVQNDYQGFMNGVKTGIEDARVRNNNEVNSKIDSVLSKNLNTVEDAHAFLQTSTERKNEAKRGVESNEKKARKKREEIGKEKNFKHESDVVLEMRGRVKELELERETVSKKITELDLKIDGLESEFQALKDVPRNTRGKMLEQVDAKIKKAKRDRRHFERWANRLDVKIESKSITLAEKERSIPADPKGLRDTKIAALKEEIEGLDAKNKELKQTIKDIERKADESKEVIAAHKKQMDELTDQIIEPYDEHQLHSFADSYYQGVMNLKDGDAHFTVNARPNILKQRRDILDSFLEPWLEKNWSNRLDQHMKALSPRIRIAERFGDFEMTETLKDINQRYTDKHTRLISEGKIKEANEVIEEKISQVKNIEFMRDSLLGRAFKDDPTSVWTSIGRSTLNFNVATSLNGMAISSAPEVGKIIAKYSAMDFSRSLAKAMKHWRIKDLPQDEAMRIASSVYRAQGTRTAQMNDVYDLTPTTALEDVTRKLAQMTNYWSGQQGMDSVLKSVVGNLAQDVFVRAVRAGEWDKLRSLGFTHANMRVIKREMPLHAAEEDGLWVPHMDRWDLRLEEPDIEPGSYRPETLRDNFNAMIVKEADTIIVAPGVGDRPEVLTGITARILTQFKSFLIASTNRTLIPLTQGSNINMFKNMAYMNGLGMLSYVMYETARGKEIDWDDHEKLVNEMLNRGGYTGYASELVQLYKMMAGEQAASRYQNRGLSGMLGGPTIGNLESLQRAISLTRDAETGELTTDTDARVHAFRKLLPFQNHPVIRRGLDQVEAEAAKALGGEGRFGNPN